MPVPLYRPGQVSTRAAPTPYAQPSGPGAALAGLGADIRGVGHQVQQAAQVERQRQDLARVQEGLAGLSDWRSRNLTGPEGLLGKKGRDALQRADQYLADFDSTAEAISSSLANEDQREAFRRTAMQQRESVQERIEAHEVREADRLAAGAFEGVVAGAVSDAANAWDSPQAVTAARQDAMAAVLARGKAQGWSPEETDQQLRSVTSALHLGVVDRMLAAGDGLGAQAYLARHGGEVDGRARAQADKQAAVAGLDQRALEATRGIQGRAQDVGAQLELARAIPDARLQEEVTQRIQQDFGRAKAAEQARRNDVFESAFTAHLKGGSLGAVPPATKAWLVANAPEEWDRLRQKARQDAEYWRRLRAEGKAETPEQRAAMVQFLFDLGSNPERYLGMRPQDFVTEWGTRLSPRDFETAGNRVAGVKAETNKPDRNPSLAPLVEKMLTVRGVEAGLWPAGQPEKWRPEQYEAYRLAHEDLVAREQAWRRAHSGQQPPSGEFDKWLTEDFLRVKLKGAGFFSSSPTLLQYERRSEYRGKELEERSAAKAALVRAGVAEPTEELVDQLLERQRAQVAPSPSPAPGPPAAAPEPSHVPGLRGPY